MRNEGPAVSASRLDVDEIEEHEVERSLVHALTSRGRTSLQHCVLAISPRPTNHFPPPPPPPPPPSPPRSQCPPSSPMARSPVNALKGGLSLLTPDHLAPPLGHTTRLARLVRDERPLRTPRHLAFTRPADHTGLAFYHSLGKALFFEATCYGYWESTRTKSLSSRDNHPSTDDVRDAYNVTALLTAAKLVIVGLKPFPKTWYRKHRNEGGGQMQVLRGAGMPPPTTPVLVYSWGPMLNLLLVSELKKREQFTSERTGKLVTVEVGRLVLEEKAQWRARDNQIIAVTASALEVYDVRTRELVEHVDVDTSSLVSLTIAHATNYTSNSSKRLTRTRSSRSRPAHCAAVDRIANERSDRAERVINPACLDIDQVVQPCDATPPLPGVGRDRSGTADWPIVNAYKVYPYLADVLSGLTYPSEEPLDEDKGTEAKRDLDGRLKHVSAQRQVVAQAHDALTATQQLLFAIAYSSPQPYHLLPPVFSLPMTMPLARARTDPDAHDDYRRQLRARLETVPSPPLCPFSQAHVLLSLRQRHS
ncbi:hypothetical protein BC826DRAFT_1186135 [Russula brevipes]|nr:hypothetical protein BC826DRAFT_1186135 [Russula brevipes]